MVNKILNSLFGAWVLLRTIDKGAKMASDIPYYFREAREYYLETENKIDETGLETLIKESEQHLERIEQEIETIKSNNENSQESEFELINKELVEKERFKEELKKLIHRWEMKLSKMRYGNK